MATYDWSLKADFVSYSVCEAAMWDENDLSTFGKPGHMLDIGGNIGYFSLAFAHAGWTVTTFEPMASNLALLNASLCLHPDIASKVKINAFGLGAKSQECKLVSPPENVGDGHVQCGDAVASGFTQSNIGKYNVQDMGSFSLRRLDDVLKEQGIDKVDLVKIDVEGYESQVLAGAPTFLSQYSPRLFKTEVWNNSFGFSGAHLLNEFQRGGYDFFSDSQCRVPMEAHSELARRGLIDVFMCKKRRLN